MSRLFTRRPLAVFVCTAALVSPSSSFAQLAPGSPPKPLVTQLASVAHAELRGVVLDDRGQPLAGVMISAVGGTSAFAVSDRSGRFTLRDLPAGPYLVRAHLQGYVAATARIIQVTPSARDISIALTRAESGSEPPQILQAGVGGVETTGDEPADDNVVDQSEVAWRLRHLKRSVLKDLDGRVAIAGSDNSFMEDSLSALGRAMGRPVRFASDLIGDLPLNGQINLLTTTAFDRPQDLLSPPARLPNSVAYVTLTAPTSIGKWDVRGGTTQGDLFSWIVAGSYAWHPPESAHQYRAGMSYAVQRYLGGNSDALAAMADRRNAGEMYAFDDWAVASRLRVGYGARYARYDYLAHATLFSPKASVTVNPFSGSNLRVRGAVSHREMAPGAEEFQPPSNNTWLPPGRTFSPASLRLGFRPERIDHVEVAIEQPLSRDVVAGFRAFHQQVADQIVTLFGVSLPDTVGAGIGHYYAGNLGDVDVRGWGLSVSRSVGEGIRASVDYTQSDANWVRPAVTPASLALVTPSVVRPRFEQLRDFTTSLESALPLVATRVFVVYKVNSGSARAGAATLRPQSGTRFDVEVNQALPFLNFTSAQWEMVIAVRNLFHEDLLDASVYDELQVVRPPKHVVGGVTVRF